MKKLPQTVVVLGLVSFFTDLSSEMIYPLLPIFLTGTLGASVVALGVIEGIAEGVASLLKLFSGLWTDRFGKRKPFVLAGYGIAGLVRPCIGLATTWPVVLGLRFTDRIGKGLRGSPRDALITDVVEPQERGRAFGYHRAMDHAGSVIGPLVAAVLLGWAGFSLRGVFLAAAAPAVIVILLIVFKVRETSKKASTRVSGLGWIKDGAPRGPFRWFLGSAGIFTLGNATDAFLLLSLSEAGVSAPNIALLWSAHHVIKLIAAYFAGDWSDRVGRRIPILTGWTTHVLVYLGFAWALAADGRVSMMIAFFLFYGLTQGLTEPAEKALVADLAPSDHRGAAFGYYHLVIGAAVLPASLLFGLIWSRFGPGAAFLTDGLLALVGAAVFFIKCRPNAAPIR